MKLLFTKLISWYSSNTDHPIGAISGCLSRISHRGEYFLCSFHAPVECGETICWGVGWHIECIMWREWGCSHCVSRGVGRVNRAHAMHSNELRGPGSCNWLGIGPPQGSCRLRNVWLFKASHMCSIWGMTWNVVSFCNWVGIGQAWGSCGVKTVCKLFAAFRVRML